MSYKKLKIWELARETALMIHLMSMKLPSFENWEEGQQIRRSSKTTKSCIVEGYGRRMYKQDWIKFLIYAHSSNDETIDHLETLWETGSLTDRECFEAIKTRLDILGRSLNNFIKAVQASHIASK